MDPQYYRLSRRAFLKRFSGSIALAAVVPSLFSRKVWAASGDKTTGLFYDSRCKDFISLDGSGVEVPQRLDAIIDNFSKSGLLKELSVVSGLNTDILPHIRKLHSEEHLYDQSYGIKNIEEGQGSLAAEIALAGVLGTVLAVNDGIIKNGFCAIRPPGHHVTNRGVYGFCYYANAALAARYAQDICKLKKVLIVDWDYHHGNGTQDFFYDDSSVLFLSTHSEFGWPGTGAPIERGAGAGEGYTINAYLDSDPTDEGLLKVYRDQLLPAVESFKPDIIIISAGFDSRVNDTLGRFHITDEGFFRATEFLIDIAETYCGGKIVSLLEGGYNLDGLARGANAHVAALSNKNWQDYMLPIEGASLFRERENPFYIMGHTLVCPSHLPATYEGIIFTPQGKVVHRLSLNSGQQIDLKKRGLAKGSYIIHIYHAGNELHSLPLKLW